MFGGLPLPDGLRKDVVRQGACAGKRQARDDGEDGRERDGGNESKQRLADQQLRNE